MSERHSIAIPPECLAEFAEDAAATKLIATIGGEEIWSVARVKGGRLWDHGVIRRLKR